MTYQIQARRVRRVTCKQNALNKCNYTYTHYITHTRERHGPTKLKNHRSTYNIVCETVCAQGTRHTSGARMPRKQPHACKGNGTHATVCMCVWRQLGFMCVRGGQCEHADFHRSTLRSPHCSSCSSVYVGMLDRTRTFAVVCLNVI